MKLSSSAFKDQGIIPEDYTCHGKGSIPPLAITEVPNGTKSFVLIVDDPDAVSGLFIHWIVWNISPDVSMISNEKLPGAVEGKNSTGNVGYITPCPPAGTGMHHYCFKLFALKQLLELTENTTRDQLESVMRGLIIAKAELIGLSGF